MTTNNPGTVTQQPRYGCTSCYEQCTHPAYHLRVHDNECWCDSCWDQRQEDFPDQPGWYDLEPYAFMLHDDRERLQAKCQILESELATVKKVAYGNVGLLDERGALVEALLKARSAVATLAGIRSAGVYEGDEEHGKQLYALLGEIDTFATYRKQGGEV